MAKVKGIHIEQYITDDLKISFNNGYNSNDESSYYEMLLLMTNNSNSVVMFNLDGEKEIDAFIDYALRLKTSRDKAKLAKNGE